MRHAMVTLEGERPFPRPFAEPRLVAELHRERQALQHVGAVRDVVQALAPYTNQGANCSSTAPSLPERRSGSRPVLHRSAGSAEACAACPVNRRNAFTLNTKPAGVRFTQRRAVCSAGSA
jgi:hypothetical protein